MPLRTKPVFLVGSVVAGLLLVAFCAVVALLGGFLNHCRGGYAHFDREWWSQHFLGKMVFVIPTALIVMVFGFHLRGSLVVFLMTWLSLYVGWDSYMNIGSEQGYCSPTGTFDWLLGRQEALNTTIIDRFVREYSGMSLRGLVWTLPQGYALEQMGFGWEFSLTGSIMPFIYYIGSRTNTSHIHGHQMRHLMDGTIAISELVWGVWVWFVLIISSLSQTVRMSRIWLYKRNPSLGFKPFSACEKVKYETLDRSLLRGFYDGFVLVLTLLYCSTLVYYSLVKQSDKRDKGQTFFGLFTAVLFLVFSQAWMWGVRHQTFLRKRFAQKLRGRTRTNNAIYNETAGNGETPVAAEGTSSPPEVDHMSRLSLSSNEMNHCEGLANATDPNSSPRRSQGPMLSWPYSHPDRLSPMGEQRQQVLELSPHACVARGSTFTVVWTVLEKYVWMDVFIYARRTIGIFSFIATIFAVMMTITGVFQGWNSPRFMQDLNPPC